MALAHFSVGQHKNSGREVDTHERDMSNRLNRNPSLMEFAAGRKYCLAHLSGFEKVLAGLALGVDKANPKVLGDGRCCLIAADRSLGTVDQHA